ncbi:MAG: hypothetical protein Q8L86_15880 [Vicinamibacterales bacterium]|nr:hypothetical protein [Vicinamibacterales bacterium]
MRSALLAVGLLVGAAQPNSGDVPDHQWSSSTAGALMVATLTVAQPTLADGESVTFMLACNVQSATPAFMGAVRTENVGVRADQGMRIAFVEDKEPSAMISVPILKEGYTPQHVEIAAGYVATLAKRLALSREMLVEFTDAFGTKRSLRVSVGNAPDLPDMLAPCVL